MLLNFYMHYNMVKSKWNILLLLMFIPVIASSQPYTFQDRLYDFKMQYSCYDYTAPGEKNRAVYSSPMNVYFSTYGQITVELPDKVITFLATECETGLKYNRFKLFGTSWTVTFTGEDCNLTIYWPYLVLRYRGAEYISRNEESNVDQFSEIYILAEENGFFKDGGGHYAPLSSDAKARAQREAELRTQREAAARKAREEAEEARRKAEAEEKRRQEEEARFRAQPISARTDAVTVPEIFATYPEGEAKLQDYLRENLRYPAIAREEGIEGRVIVQFIVEPDGSFSSVEVKKSPDPSFNKEAIRLIKSMPRWFPATVGGVPVPSVVTQVIRFKL